MHSNFYIYANYYLNWATIIACIVNILCMAVLAITAFVERKDLDEIVTEVNWKTPIIVSVLLSLAGMGCLFLSSLGLVIFWISLIALGLQIFFVLDDYSALAKDIAQPEWYLTAHKISAVIAFIACLCLTLFLLSTIVVTDY